MSITLTDIPAAVADYLDSHVVMAVSAVTPDDPKQTVLTPRQHGTFTVSATNGDPADGVKLHGLVYHVKVQDDAVLRLVPPDPNGLLLRAFKDLAATEPITDTKPVGEVYLVPLILNTLDPGEVGTPITIEVHCIAHGQTTITARLHADIEPDDLFPSSRSKNGSRTVDVV